MEKIQNRQGEKGRMLYYVGGWMWKEAKTKEVRSEQRKKKEGNEER